MRGRLGLMDFLLVVLVMFIVIGGGIYLARRSALTRQANERRDLESQLAAVKRVAEEDVTKFGEELQALDTDVAGHALDEPMQQDYTRALDAYEDAKSSLDAVTKPDEIKHVTEILEDGRYAMACVKARVGGRPLPAKRPPCFFNPQHGPSTENVNWSPPGGTPRDVPACAADAERVKVGADPYIRTVAVGAQRVPYWQGGPAYQPYYQGYYNSWRGSDMLTGMMIGGLLFGGGDLFGGIGEGIGAIGEGIGGMFEGIGEGIGGIGEGLGDMFDGFFD